MPERLETDHARRRLTISGVVQGVGFRPFVHRLARQGGLSGFARNTAEGLVVEIQGPGQDLDRFVFAISDSAPPLARVLDVVSLDLPVLPGEAGFVIRKSAAGAGHSVLVSPDSAVCDACLDEMFDPADRRYLYAFTNCTDCGPRHTITAAIPYDRPATSMACFPMCARCQTEYDDPGDRRFHAQPNACPACGPDLWLADASGARLAAGDAAISRLAEVLVQGGLAAIKGLGGFHLCCRADQDRAVGLLRARKNRPAKALAVMVPDLATAARLAEAGETARELLSGRVRPIVVCPKRPGSPVSPLAAPDTDSLGLMLPYTPLHHVLFHHYRALLPGGVPAVLVMTSGNAASEPICLGNREALRRLSGIADVFLLHTRDILIRVDDSVVRPLPAPRDAVPGAPPLVYYRRARGYVPAPVFLAGSGPPVLGLGPMLKCTVTLTKGDQAFVSQHIGDLENLETYGFYQETIAHLCRILSVTPVLAVRDLHPDYLSSRHAGELSIPSIAVQHHFAHIHAVLAEHKHAAPALGLALDGTGFGEDGTVWGGEGLYLDPAGLTHRRLARFAPVPMPGGEAAIREPWRMAMGYLSLLGENLDGDWPWRERFAPAQAVVAQMIAKKVNCPLTSSCGRLFDAVSALLGLCPAAGYEGQAAIILERIQDHGETKAYACPVIQGGAAGGEGFSGLTLDTPTLFAQVLEDVRRGIAAGAISRRFHLGLTGGLVRLAGEMAAASGIVHVGLSGGVMQNLTLAALLPETLARVGLVPLCHRELPANDGCISLGQAAYGRLHLARKKG